MTMANFMTRRRPAASGTERHEKPPGSPEEHKTDWKGYIMLAVGLALFTIGGIFSNAPLKGQHKFLVATSDMPMKEFDKAVVFILAHNKGMARGLIVNMPGRKKGAPGFGGPQERGKIFALHTLDVRLPETIVMDDVGLGLEEGKASVDKIRNAKTKPAWYVVVDGYTGWAAGQMEQEMSDGDWELVEFDRKVLTTTPPAKLWDATKQLPRFVLTH